MKQFPSRLKFKKNHKLKASIFKLKDQKTFFPLNGNFMLKSIESGILTFKQIESCRKSIRRSIKKSGSLLCVYLLAIQLQVNL